MMGKNKSGLLDTILAAKMGAEKRLQAAGRQIRKNYDQGQKDYKSGKIKGYSSINLFKNVF